MQAALRKKAKQLQALQGERDMRHAQCAEQELSMSSMRVCSLKPRNGASMQAAAGHGWLNSVFRVAE